ncbi:MAG TPA: prepilin-type N-terminal cleavage/methylation domain-containing protein [Steroidobacteraceae bacterium]|jgi:Tfp pilus assembly protein PilV|nr:prepilin-type N-terminal cleavage/methylation domain-containing protein [Steroidobacteraceae bacterium]
MRILTHHRARGVTLVELVVSIVVIATAGVALSSTLAYLNGTGNTSILQAQAQSIANAYLDNIMDKNFAPSPAPFDDVNDYDGLDNPVALDLAGNAAGNFRVQVSVGPGVLNGLPAAAVRRIDVTVAYGATAFVVATGYRTGYP